MHETGTRMPNEDEMVQVGLDLDLVKATKGLMYKGELTPHQTAKVVNALMLAMMLKHSNPKKDK